MLLAHYVWSGHPDRWARWGCRGEERWVRNDLLSYQMAGPLRQLLLPRGFLPGCRWTAPREAEAGLPSVLPTLPLILLILSPLCPVDLIFPLSPPSSSFQRRLTTMRPELQPTVGTC